MARTGAPASGAGHDINRDCEALQGAPGDDHRQVADIGSTNDFYKVVTSGVTTGPIRGSELQRRVSTATPFAPQGAGHQEGRRESSVDTRHHAVSMPVSEIALVRWRLLVALRRHLMRLHFLLNIDRQSVAGIDASKSGLWYGS